MSNDIRDQSGISRDASAPRITATRAELFGYVVIVALAVIGRVQHWSNWIVLPLVALVLIWHQVARRVFPPKQ